MQRYFLKEQGEINRRYKLTSKDDVHHIKNVMRQQVEDRLIVNFLNASYEVEIVDIADSIEVEAIKELKLSTELPVHVTIASGILKNDKYEWMLQKATELGAAAFMPFQGEFSVVKWDARKADKRLERFRKIIKEAAEQSYRQSIPDIEFAGHLKDIEPDFDHIIIAYEESAKAQEQRAFKQVLSDFNPDDKVLLVFGPEGGLSEKEIETLAGVKAGLGPRILRAETAPLYALSAISYHLELQGE
ncbi:16S rRNA (uracil(1498)-N(3))-methyltransferase [Macrococcus hajekii]|uniref:Ribosomal RNA small subunit methyltransferase E n=1 Tax=Macrococcus hajekii TaxID=198482 RepID=A0A4R6BM31_9STAP|nr:16S rRNA (uracil(1498)-N(3))-methyltransferase [Macrococcus hajekii]TDM02874.1 16S rRNA (uracil(1498)-N(3))-methyltransferase [Macrococcus hajekii]GGB04558.1 ribosomal RNA small subunit methyltransferase E [Macrococcus hajekii]